MILRGSGAWGQILGQRSTDIHFWALPKTLPKRHTFFPLYIGPIFVPCFSGFVTLSLLLFHYFLHFKFLFIALFLFDFCSIFFSPFASFQGFFWQPPLCFSNLIFVFLFQLHVVFIELLRYVLFFRNTFLFAITLLFLFQLYLSCSLPLFLLPCSFSPLPSLGKEMQPG